MQHLASPLQHPQSLSLAQFGHIPHNIPFQASLRFWVAPLRHFCSKTLSVSCRQIGFNTSKMATGRLSLGMYWSSAPALWRCQPHHEASPSGQNLCRSSSFSRTTVQRRRYISENGLTYSLHIFRSCQGDTREYFYHSLNQIQKNNFFPEKLPWPPP